jgi:transcriptional regulator of arginine metabolism
MNTSYRQAQILKLVQQKRLHTQDELARELADLGIQATQVTLSRDIRKLGLAKTAEGYVQLGTAPKVSHLESLAEFLKGITPAQNLLVIKTTPGMAQGLAAELDDAQWPEIVGTIAGDDTILIVTPDNGTAQNLREKLLGLLA